MADSMIVRMSSARFERKPMPTILTLITSLESVTTMVWRTPTRTGLMTLPVTGSAILLNQELGATTT